MTERRGILDSVPALVPYHPNQNLPCDPDLESVDAWIRPNPDLDARAIRLYALTFGAYEYARQKDFDLAAFVNERRAKFEETGEWAGTFEELRCCLFLEQRSYRWSGLGSPDEDVTF